MTLPVLTVITIIFIIWINYEIHKNSKRSKEDTEKFWNRENESNLSRRADISSLNYILVSADHLPTADGPDESVNYYRDIILGLSGKKVMNLSGYTNTELKYKYGAANLKELIECDSNYISFVGNLQKWADRLYELGDTEKAMVVLEYAVTCKTDVIKSYQLLAAIYKQQSQTGKIKFLIDSIPLTNILDKDKLTRELTILSNS